MNLQLYNIENQSMLEAVEWETESALDAFLFAHPEALSQALYPEEDNRLLPLARQFEQIDILYLRLPTNDNPSYGLLICEDKKGSNPELRRTVLAQVVDYAATISALDEADFTTQLNTQIQKPEVHNAHKRFIEREILAKDEVNDCLQNAVEAQQNGNIQCVICAKTIPEQLLQMVRIVNATKQGQIATRLLNACKVEKWQGQEVKVATVASMLALLEEEDAFESLSVDAENLLTKAVAIAESPTFNIRLAKVLQTESLAVLDDPDSISTPKARLKSDNRITDVKTSLSKMPESIRVLYEMLDKSLTQKKNWRTGQGTGAQLVLEIPIDRVSKPFHILRLKNSGMSFVLFYFLNQNGLSEIHAWARQSLADVGIKDSEAKQPSLSLKEIAKLHKEHMGIVLFITELCERVQKALATS